MQAISCSKNTHMPAPRFIVPDGVKFTSNAIGFGIETELDHKADPIKDIHDIMRVSNYLIERHMYQFNLMFIMGINFGLRIGDLLELRIGNIIDESLEYRFPIEIRERKRGKPRKLYVNQAVDEAFSLYISHKQEVDLNEYLFVGRNNTTPMSRQNVDKRLRKIKADLNLPYHCGTHIFRKTFSYWVLMTASDRQRALYYLQKILNHSSATTTLFYAGITDDEIMRINMNLNLGFENTDILDTNSVFRMEENQYPTPENTIACTSVLV